jgi:hypothetical protein
MFWCFVAVAVAASFLSPVTGLAAAVLSAVLYVAIGAARRRRIAPGRVLLLLLSPLIGLFGSAVLFLLGPGF